MVTAVEGSRKGTKLDANAEHYKAAITLSNLVLYDLTPLTWHIHAHAGNRLEAQVPHDHPYPRVVITEWAEMLQCDFTETEYDEHTSVRLETNYGDYGTFIKIWGHVVTQNER
jgi:hypothetical protein